MADLWFERSTHRETTPYDFAILLNDTFCSSPQFEEDSQLFMLWLPREAVQVEVVGWSPPATYSHHLLYKICRTQAIFCFEYSFTRQNRKENMRFPNTSLAVTTVIVTKMALQKEGFFINCIFDFVESRIKE